MKSTKIHSKVAVALLVFVGLCSIPALSWQEDDNPGGIFQWPMFCMKNNITGDELDNMTLGELKEIKKQARNDTADADAFACPLRGMNRNDRNGREMSRSWKMNGLHPMGTQVRGGWDSLPCLKEHSCGYGPMGEPCCRGANECNGSEICCAPQQDRERSRCGIALEIISEVSPVLLMDDLTADDLQNMTLKEIRSLAQEKTQELDNMTLSEVRQIVKTRLSDRDNMTLFDLKKDTRNMRQMSRIIEWVSSEHHFKA